MENEIREIFKKGSKTYFNSSIFFPKSIRDDVYYLYAFVRKADDFVDAIPQQKSKFYNFCNKYRSALNHELSNDIVIQKYIELCNRKNFPKDWTEAFLHSMELDIKKNQYSDIEETLDYIYGSAEVIGLFMSSIMNLSKDAYDSAKMLGRAMQYINFIRDIDEDNTLNRRYIPIKYYNLNNLSEEECRDHDADFRKLISDSINLYFQWQLEAEKGFPYIPKRYLIPIKTASDMYKWTANVIRKNPYIIFEKKIKPSKLRIIFTGIKNAVIL